MHHPDIRQGHPVEGVILAGGIDGHVAEDEPVTLGEGGGKAVIAHHVPGKAGGAAQPEGAGLFPRFARVQQGRAVGHLDAIRRVAGCGHIQNGKVCLAILQGVQHCGDEVACVQRPGLARFQIHLHAVLFLRPGDALFQRGKVVIRAGDVVPPAKVEPLHPGQQVTEFRFQRGQGGRQCVGILLAQGVEVQAVQQVGQVRVLRRSGIPLGTGGAQTAARGAGVIDLVALLGGVLGVHPQAHALARRLCGRAELCQLVGRVEHDVVSVLQQLLELVGPVGGAEHMVFLLRQLLPAQAALVQAAGLGARQIRSQHRVNIKVGKGLLGQQDLAACPLLHAQQDLAVAAQPGFIQQVAGGGQCSQCSLGEVRQPRKGWAGVGQPHQSTRAGAWLSERGRPYLSRASRYGSGSNSSTVCTPLVVHLPVSSISAPHMAGTPVV